MTKTLKYYVSPDGENTMGRPTLKAIQGRSFAHLVASKITDDYGTSTNIYLQPESFRNCNAQTELISGAITQLFLNDSVMANQYAALRPAVVQHDLEEEIEEDDDEIRQLKEVRNKKKSTDLLNCEKSIAHNWARNGSHISFKNGNDFMQAVFSILGYALPKSTAYDINLTPVGTMS